jgi:hypothetical protein
MITHFLICSSETYDNFIAKVQLSLKCAFHISRLHSKNDGHHISIYVCYSPRSFFYNFNFI